MVSCIKHLSQDNFLSMLIFFVDSQRESFRHEFANLGEVSSLLPDVHIMSLTATASKNTRRTICRLIGMKKVLLTSQSSNKLNIFYSVNCKQKDLEEAIACEKAIRRIE